MTTDPVPMVDTRINGKWNIKLPAHRASREEWVTGWEPERLDSMYANLRPGDVVYDVGTEEGDMSGLFAQWVLPTGGIVLFEPNEMVWPNVKAIFEANGLAPPLAYCVGFASDKDTPGGYPKATSWAHGLRTGPWPQAADGPVIGDHGFKSLVESEHTYCNARLDSVANHVVRPSAITMDCEGSELRVLHGASDILTRDRPLVWISVHVLMIQYDYGATAEDVHRYMGNHGYRMHQLAMDHECHWFYWPQEREVVLP